MSVKVDLNVWNKKITWINPKSSENFGFDWFGWNASESEVGLSYGGQEENEFRMRRDVIWGEVKTILSDKKLI